MYTLIGQNFINMIKQFYPQAKIASGGREIVVRCRECGDSKDPKHAHMYIKVPQSENEVSLYQCKKCNARGIVDDAFLRRYGCDDTRMLVEIVKHNSDVSKHTNRSILNKMDVYPLINKYYTDQSWNQYKIDYINNRIGSNMTLEELMSLKIFLNLGDVLQQNKLTITRDSRIIDSLNEHFIGFISYDNSYSILRKVDDVELYKTLNKRYVNYNLINKVSNSKDFYVIPTSINVEDPTPVNIHIAEGVFDILSIFYNLNKSNRYQNIYIASAGKSYSQALNFILNETGIINYKIHIYPDNDVSDYELNYLITKGISMLSTDIIIHRNNFQGEKDYGVPLNRIQDTARIIYEKKI